MKRKLLLILSITALFCLPLSIFGGCGGHVHEYSKKVVEPTCTTKGYTLYTCTCGDSYTGETTEYASHDLENHQGQPSTCLVKGYKEYQTCKNCEYTTYEELPLIEHQLQVLEEVKGNCLTGEKGYKKEKCENCDYEKITTLNASHVWESVPAQKANCYGEGWNAHSKCKVCGVTSNTVTISPIRHDKIVNVAEKKSTCTEQGYYAHTKCESCGEEFDKQLMPLYAHSTYTEEKVIKEAKCMVEGEKATIEKCRNCDYEKELERNSINALEHLIESQMGEDSTCYSKGYYSYEYCTREGCEYTTYQEIPIKEHVISIYSGKNPTCLEKGYKEYEKCINQGCNYSTFEEIDSLGHDEHSVKGKSATCNYAGYEAYVYCSRCNYTTYNEIAPLGHDLHLVDYKQTSCLEEGHHSYEKCLREGC